MDDFAALFSLFFLLSMFIIVKVAITKCSHYLDQEDLIGALK